MIHIKCNNAPLLRYNMAVKIYINRIIKIRAGRQISTWRAIWVWYIGNAIREFLTFG